METKTPLTLNIRESYRKEYNRLLEKDSPFAGKDNKHLFIITMAIGFREKNKIKLDKKYSYVRIEYLNQKEESIIKAIAIAEEGKLDVLLDKRRLYSIAEEYAAGGIKLLKEKVFSSGFGSYIKKLESELIDEFNKIEKDINA